MLTLEQNFILSLLQKSLYVVTNTTDTPEDLKYVKNVIRHSGVLLTVYDNLPTELQQSFSAEYLHGIKQAILQDYEGKTALNALSDAGLNCIALKGWELRHLYPKTTMRQMADLDILIKPYFFSIIKSVMEGLGYTSGSESNWKHDSFRKNEVHVEMHKRLTDDSSAIQVWENGLWDRATVLGGSIYKMSPEDYYIFHFVHLHKDFMNGSLGLRRIVDTWLLQKQPVDIDRCCQVFCANSVRCISP